ncbi:phosphoribosylaminoimidazolesuccinocarboxamide synthase [Candidatus Berkiella aquae]|uniref:Phosphoribosylaminoimidazole-succinocarboxamide synthase n=1 Tax=Candidatus Berkiella aquae TaxID=295108 RepID=A0A0Q9YNF3_9GAMM|nr:phosphoribosylaminoimidazolesuccinocarboxamide synthase [Candidatus Berkiella aquae]MCS5712464.1 phosphoribosylaminoimidazolesuccinocarboxamide synthase [Candidatus Berkiella aquae]
MDTQQLLYKGKAKSLYATENADELLCVYRNDTSAFDGEKIVQLDRKGMVNNQFNAFIMQKLQQAGIPNHFIKMVREDASLVKRLKMIPVECVVRNVAAGSLCRRLGVEPGLELKPATFEFFLKNDALHDPMVNDSLIITFGWATQEQIDQMKTYTFAVNEVLKKLFSDAGLILVDYKLEFGVYQDTLILGDEFSPDGCRIWDAQTKKVLDKDRFRKDMGDVVEGYEEVAQRLGISLTQTA